MTCFYIRESLESNRLRLLFKYLFNKIEIRDNIIELPIRLGKIIKNNKVKKIVKKLKEKNVRIAVLSKKLEKNELLKNEMYENYINIIDGRLLFKILSKEVLWYVCKKSQCDIKNIEISILVNDLNSLNKDVIMDLAENVKILNIITNNINDFKSIENKLYDEKGIVIRITNNKKKGLLKSKIIINLDFCEEKVNTYNIPQNCIIINTNKDIRIKTKRFNGININDYNIIMPNKYKIQGFEDSKVYESLIINSNYEKAREIIKKDSIIIKNLIGEKGVIQNNEFKKK